MYHRAGTLCTWGPRRRPPDAQAASACLLRHQLHAPLPPPAPIVAGCMLLRWLSHVQVGHVAHLAGAAVGVLLVVLLSKLPETAD